MIKKSEITLLQDMKSSKISGAGLNSLQMYRKTQKEKLDGPYQNKINSLRTKIEQTVKQSKTKEIFPYGKR